MSHDNRKGNRVKKAKIITIFLNQFLGNIQYTNFWNKFNQMYTNLSLIIIIIRNGTIQIKINTVAFFFLSLQIAKALG